jgi:hippurate hydrolase
LNVLNIDGGLKELVPVMTEWRHYLHAHPETAFEEKLTGRFIANKLSEFGLEVDSGIAGTGVVGTLRMGTGGKTIGLRADIDALDIEEKTGLSYSSVNAGKMHACGHDGHTAMLMGAAKYLAENGGFNGTIRFIFQPAEENEGGGKAMVTQGLFEKYPVEAVFGLHNFPVLPQGYFAICSGPMMAAFDIFNIAVKGKGGHGGLPHMTNDPVVAAAHLITALQGVVSRNISPIDSAVVSVTMINAGTTHNVIPDTVKLAGTTRHFTAEVQNLVEKRIREMCDGVARTFNVEIALDYQRRYPAVVNTEQQTLQAAEAAIAVVGKECVLTGMPPSTGSEDFAFMLQHKPGAYMIIGAGNPRENGMPHQAGYDFNDELLPIGAAYWVRLALQLLK